MAGVFSYFQCKVFLIFLPRYKGDFIFSYKDGDTLKSIPQPKKIGTNIVLILARGADIPVGKSGGAAI